MTKSDAKRLRLLERVACAAGCPKDQNCAVWFIQQGLIIRPDPARPWVLTEKLLEIIKSVDRKDRERAGLARARRAEKAQEREFARQRQCAINLAKVMRDPADWFCAGIPHHDRLRVWAYGARATDAESNARLLALMWMEKHGFGKDVGLAAWEFVTFPPRRDHDGEDVPDPAPVPGTLVSA
jgi:hypothetical protein